MWSIPRKIFRCDTRDYTIKRENESASLSFFAINMSSSFSFCCFACSPHRSDRSIFSQDLRRVVMHLVMFLLHRKTGARSILKRWSEIYIARDIARYTGHNIHLFTYCWPIDILVWFVHRGIYAVIKAHPINSANEIQTLPRCKSPLRVFAQSACHEWSTLSNAKRKTLISLIFMSIYYVKKYTLVKFIVVYRHRAF